MYTPGSVGSLCGPRNALGKTFNLQIGSVPAHKCMLQVAHIFLQKMHQVSDLNDCFTAVKIMQTLLNTSQD